MAEVPESLNLARQVKVMVKLGGTFQRRPRLADSPRPARKKLEKSEQEKRWLSQVPPGSSGARLERQKFKASPKEKELPPNFIYAKAAVPGDRIVAADDYGDVILEVVEVSPWMVVCVDVRTGRALGVLPSCIVELGS